MKNLKTAGVVGAMGLFLILNPGVFAWGNKVDSSHPATGTTVDGGYLFDEGKPPEQASPDHISVVLDNNDVYFPDAKPYIDSDSGRTLVPIRFVAQQMKAQVNWDDGTQQATINLNGKQIVLTVNSQQATVNGQGVGLDAAPTLKDGRTYVPLRFISEVLIDKTKLGGKNPIDWDPQYRVIRIHTK
ncbi:copper amine oxidase N-terminal domain-containing protein [Effusibacillus dendaii]|uniref:Copper amine oxidase-like N-terminal domain-containing protein n=1 Tax=Effusibacillus dendaii TaxID=2743772 RepID=A0A7I8DBD9_9BACL|nr:copper amine oxidase N-terminal domain-containing protein [Effusibacillus dendaii]BCJ85830.1 hypothetical protein skT53_08150 [Effusibacillus dendaii]